MSLGNEPLVDTQVDPAIAEAAARLAAGTPLIPTPASDLRTAYIRDSDADQTLQSNGAVRDTSANNGSAPAPIPAGVVPTTADTTLPSSDLSAAKAATPGVAPSSTSSAQPIPKLAAAPNGRPTTDPVNVAPQGIEGPAKDIINKLANGGIAPGPGKVRLTNYVSLALESVALDEHG